MGFVCYFDDVPVAESLVKLSLWYIDHSLILILTYCTYIPVDHFVMAIKVPFLTNVNKLMFIEKLVELLVFLCRKIVILYLLVNFLLMCLSLWFNLSKLVCKLCTINC